MGNTIQVLIVRDREAAGGGIFNYYQAVGKYLGIGYECVDVGRLHGFYAAGGGGFPRFLPTPFRLLFDWIHFALTLLRCPDLVVLNPCLDPIEFRSLPRDAVNLLLAKLFRRRVLVFWRGWDNEICGSAEFPGGNGGWLSRIYRMGDVQLVLAADFREDLQRWGFKGPIHVETTVVGDELMACSPGARDLQADWPFRVLYLSRVEEAKGVFEMLEAFALLETRFPGRYQLTVAGDGPGLAELQAKAKKMAINGPRFAGYVGGEAKIRCFLEADAFCFLSYTEGMPNAVLEAMTMGLPMVSSAAGGLKDILEEGRSGFMVGYDRQAAVRKRFSAVEVADCLERLASTPESYLAMSAHNASLGRERFAAPRVAERLDAICRQAAGSGGQIEDC